MIKGLQLLSTTTLCMLAAPSLAQTEQQETPKAVYEHYSFDFSAHERPIAYSTIGNALELVNKVKVNPAVADRGGAYLFDSHIKD